MTLVSGPLLCGQSTMVESVETGACGTEGDYLRFRFLMSGGEKATGECLFRSDGTFWQAWACGDVPSCASFPEYCGTDASAPESTRVCAEDAGADAMSNLER